MAERSEKSTLHYRQEHVFTTDTEILNLQGLMFFLCGCPRVLEHAGVKATASLSTRGAFELGTLAQAFLKKESLS